ncbi:MAG: pentapeptide repeat-containing protein [Nitrospirae bacterium]|nr:pentapeptide repeat-containing protein [Nitrospirota bacterium]
MINIRKIQVPVLLFLIIISASIAVWLVPVLQVNVDYPNASREEKMQFQNDYRESLSKSLEAAGGLAFIITAYFAWLNFKVAEDKQITDRFSKAVEQLRNDENIYCRLGGIYSLERIAKDSENDYYQTIKILAAYIRTKKPLTLDIQANKSIVENSSLLPIDIEEVLIILLQRRSIEREEKLDPGNKVKLDLSKTNLHGIEFGGAKLQRAELTGTNFKQAFLCYSNFSLAHLSKTNLSNAKLQGSSFECALLDEVDFRDSDLSDTYFSYTCFTPYADSQRCLFDRATLNNSSFKGIKPKDRVPLDNVRYEQASDFKHFDKIFVPRTSENRDSLNQASFKESKLIGAEFKCLNLTGVCFDGAILKRARFRDVDLSNVSFHNADLKNVYFEGVDLENANFEGANLEDIKWDKKTNWIDAVGIDLARNVSSNLKKKLGIEL